MGKIREHTHRRGKDLGKPYRKTLFRLLCASNVVDYYDLKAVNLCFSRMCFTMLLRNSIKTRFLNPIRLYTITLT